MKLRSASESVGWMNSVGPLTVSPQFPKPASSTGKKEASQPATKTATPKMK